MSALQLPDGLTPEQANVLRRRQRGGHSIEVDEGLSEVSSLFVEYVRRVHQQGGATDLRGELVEWEADRERAERNRNASATHLAVYEAVLGAVEVTGGILGLDTLVMDAVAEVDRLAEHGVRWTVKTVTRPGDGREVVTLWHEGQREQGRCVSTNGTWREAVASAADGAQTYRELYENAVEKAENASFHADLIRHVLRLHREGELPNGPPRNSTDAKLLTDRREFQRFVTGLRDASDLTWEAAYNEAVSRVGGKPYKSFQTFDRSRQAAEKKAARESGRMGRD